MYKITVNCFPALLTLWTQPNLLLTPSPPCFNTCSILAGWRSSGTKGGMEVESRNIYVFKIFNECLLGVRHCVVTLYAISLTLTIIL